MSFPPWRALAACLTLVPAALAAEPAPPAPAAADIRTPAAPAEPRINGPRVYGARPKHPFFYHVPTTGERPLAFSATGLPAGLTIDPETGNITGAAADPGEYAVEVTATNARGHSTAPLALKIGDAICLTPPLGWNSWNHFASRVTAGDVRAAADAMVASGLIEHGWTYVNVDDCWQGQRDAAGNIQGNARFPDLKALGDYVHGKGLKFGVYSSPGPKTCAGYVASYQHEDQDAASYASWGVDYVKYDLCSYGSIIQEHLRERTVALLPAEQREGYAALIKELQTLRENHRRTPEQEARLKEATEELKKLTAPVGEQLQALNVEEQQAPYRVFGRSLALVPRDIVYSFCQYGNASSWAWAAGLGGNCWRTTGDISANWKSMSGIGFSQDRLAAYAGPGHWNDPDMLEVGNRGLSPDECYTHLTLWCMLSAPLLIGCDLSQMDPVTVSLFSNDEVLAVDQDALGKQGHRIKAEGTSEVWVKPLDRGDVAVAFFNRGEQPAEISVSLGELEANGPAAHDHVHVLRDLWRQKAPSPDVFDLGGARITAKVAPHSAEMIRY